MLKSTHFSRSAVLVCLATMASAQPQAKLKLRALVCEPGRNVATVGFTKPSPDSKTVIDPDLWIFVAKTVANPVGSRLKVLTVKPFDAFAQDGQVTLILESTLPDSVSSVEVTLLLAGQPTLTWRPKQRTSQNTPTPPGPCFSGLGFGAAANRNKADVYLSGIWVPATGAKPTYSIDSNMTLPLCSTTFWDLLRLDGKVKTNDKPNADPDSFSAGVSIARKYPFNIANRQYLDFKWGMAQWEFSRKEEAFNFTSAPAATWAVVLAKGVDLEVPVGLEVGTNLRNHITAVRNGYGAIARLAPGAGFYAVSPKLWGNAKITWSTIYTARVLMTREPFIDHRRNPAGSMARGTRHHLENSVDLSFNDYVSLTVKHEFGSLPPAFEFVDHKATVGLVVMWAWKQ
jgi:hypothetical protein